MLDNMEEVLILCPSQKTMEEAAILMGVVYDHMYIKLPDGRSELGHVALETRIRSKIT